MNDYAYTHISPAIGNNYYRLRMVYQDGRVVYSNVRLLVFRVTIPPAPLVTAIGPNPANASAVVYLSTDVRPSTINVYDASGRLMHRTAAANGTTQVTIPTNRFAAGEYVVEVVGANRYIFRLMVRH